MFQRFEETKVRCCCWSKRCSNDCILFYAAIVSTQYFLYPQLYALCYLVPKIVKIIVYLLLYLGNIINISLRYINVSSHNKLRRRHTKDDQGNAKNQNRTSRMNQLDEEADLLRKKLEEEKARKRTRGPYRKSHMNQYVI